MVNNYAKVIAVGALAAVGVLGAISEAQAQHFKYPETNMVTEGSPSPVDWNSNRAVTPHVQQKMVFACEAQADGTYATTARMVEQTVDPDHYPVYSEEVMYESPTALINWSATLSSDNPKGAYTPESRCQAVSARLTNLSYAYGLITPEQVAQIGEASLVGTANGQRVIFISQDPKDASTRNVIFTLKPDNAARVEAPKVLTQFQTGIAGSIGGPDLAPGERPPVQE
ncbi:COP23 domain-containing protein [Crocosphaera sp. XPORK-15E]|uniref:COP23 domain-containing protein n=1 Tax=Crocosphaera sp. XPORK-15E TaxID=3110247 RepID=UPI002B21464C|nr:COP23 domain-containing protein [Crocosphaera sp. XPORK-15E]MEA5533977.1 COP23 domain-containing protein [Crocosphaera sp. XPORK-15E]